MEDAQNGTNGSERDILPTNVKPKHYDLTLELDITNPQYKGEVAIDLDVLETSNSITLHSKDHDITSASVESSAGQKFTKLPISHNKDDQTIEISLPENIAAKTTAKLTISFTAKLRDGMAGLIWPTYETKDGVQKRFIASHLEPVEARTVFPCFDEPALKATFSMTMVSDKDQTLLFNTPEASTKDVGTDKKAVTFEKTPVMSTYLLVWAVGTFDVIETNSFRIPVRLFTTANNNVEHGRYSLELAAKTLAFFEEKLGVEFPLPKMDLITVPDFMGAMENWGLVTFREDMLLLDPETNTIDQKMMVADVVPHELAHQWFGNLVTMDWWEGLWLNEGFATWAAMYTVDAFNPEWKFRQQFLTGHYKEALTFDSLRSSHPIEVPVKNADQIQQIFDRISYDKGCSIIRMIAEYVGEDTFLKGIGLYMNKHKFGNTITMDLWTALSEAIGIDVDGIMGEWTKRVGYPVVTVSEEGESGEGRLIRLTQNRFLRTGDVKPDEDEVIYTIPLTISKAGGSKEDQTLMKEREVIVPVDDAFVKINKGHVGFYRAAYSSTRLRILGGLKNQLSVEDRVGIVSDATALAPAGYQATSDVLSLLEKFSDETEMAVWKQVVDSFNAIRSTWLFEDDVVKQGLRAFQRQVVAPKAHELGWTLKDGEDQIQQQLKVLLFDAAVSAGDEKASKAAREMFRAFESGDRNAIHPDLRHAVFSGVLADPSSGEKEYDFILEQYRRSKNMQERRVLIKSLGAASSPALINRTVSLLLTDEVRKQELWDPLEPLSGSRDGALAASEWLKTNLDKIKAKANIFAVGEIVRYALINLSSLKQLAELEGFFGARDTSAFNQSLAQGMDEIRVKIGWLERGREDVQNFLKEKKLLPA